MIRNLKTLSLALVAMFVMSAMAAAGAQAESSAKFTFGAGTVKLDMAADGNQVYTLGIRTVVCTTVDGTAAVSGSEASEVTSNTDINYTNCHTTMLGLNFPTTVAQEANCHYKFTAGTYTAASNQADGSVHICGSTIEIYTNATTHAENVVRCRIHVLAKTDSMRYTNTTSEGKMAVTIHEEGESTNTVTTSTPHFLGCSAHEHNTNTYNRTKWIKGTNATGGYTDITVS